MKKKLPLTASVAECSKRYMEALAKEYPDDKSAQYAVVRQMLLSMETAMEREG